MRIINGVVPGASRLTSISGPSKKARQRLKVGRIIRRLKKRGVLKEPVPNHISARKRQRRRPYAMRKPRDYGISQVGDLVQLDTLDIRPLPGVLTKHFTAHDVISRWNSRLSKKSGNAVLKLTRWDIISERLGFGGNRDESVQRISARAELFTPSFIG